MNNSNEAARSPGAHDGRRALAREEFIALLATVWPDVRALLANGMSLPRLCTHLATDAFVKQPEAPAVLQRLREELLSLENIGAFTWWKEPG